MQRRQGRADLMINDYTQHIILYKIYHENMPI